MTFPRTTECADTINKILKDKHWYWKDVTKFVLQAFWEQTNKPNYSEKHLYCSQVEWYTYKTHVVFSIPTFILE